MHYWLKRLGFSLSSYNGWSNWISGWKMGFEPPTWVLFSTGRIFI